MIYYIIALSDMQQCCIIMANSIQVWCCMGTREHNGRKMFLILCGHFISLGNFYFICFIQWEATINYVQCIFKIYIHVLYGCVHLLLRGEIWTSFLPASMIDVCRSGPYKLSKDVYHRSRTK